MMLRIRSRPYWVVATPLVPLFSRDFQGYQRYTGSIRFRSHISIPVTYSRWSGAESMEIKPASRSGNCWAKHWPT